jgi:hypothetical protein
MEFNTGGIVEENLVHLSADNNPTTQGQIYTGVPYQEDGDSGRVIVLMYIYLKSYGKT